MKCPRCGNDVKEGAKFCQKCGGVMSDFGAQTETAASTAAHSVPAQSSGDRFDLNKYLFNKKYMKVRDTFEVCDEAGNALMYIQRVTFALKRHTYIYTDSTLQNKILTILQDKTFMFLTMDFTLVGADENVIAKFRKRNMISILRQTWDILSADGTVIGQALEDSWFKSIFRRFGGIFGEFLKTDFIISIGGRVIGKFIRRWTILDKHVLDITDDPQHTLDRRAAVALGFLIDACEMRSRG